MEKWSKVELIEKYLYEFAWSGAQRVPATWVFFSSKNDFQELGLLLVLVAVAILTYSSLVYFAERDKRVAY